MFDASLDSYFLCLVRKCGSVCKHIRRSLAQKVPNLFVQTVQQGICMNGFNKSGQGPLENVSVLIRTLLNSRKFGKLGEGREKGYFMSVASRGTCRCRLCTYMAMLIEFVVREFHLFKRHHLFEELLASKGGVWMHIESKKRIGELY